MGDRGGFTKVNKRKKTFNKVCRNKNKAYLCTPQMRGRKEEREKSENAYDL